MNIFSFEVDHFLRGVDIGLFSRTLRKTGRGTSRKKSNNNNNKKMPKQTTAKLET